MASYEYTDFRLFIKDRLAEMQKENPHLSQRGFCRRAGFSSPGLFHAILKGTRSLSPKNIPKFSKAMELTREEQKYFLALVKFNQGATTDEKMEAYEALLNFKNFRKAHTLAREQYEYYSFWYCPVIREMTALSDFREDPNFIVERLGVSLKASEIKHAIEVLEKLGLVKRNSKGKLELTDPRVTSPDEIRSVFVRKFHHEMLKRALVVLETLPLSMREVSNLTLTLNEDRFNKLREELVEFRHHLFEKYGDARVDDDRVAQVNFQFFPLTLPKPVP